VRVILLAATMIAACPLPALAAGEKSADDQEAAQRQRLLQAKQLIDVHKASEAIPLIEQTLAYYATQYPEGETRWYVARTRDENLLYVGEASLFGNREAGKSNARILSVAWAEGYFLKGFAYVELGRQKEAVVAVEHALSLSPSNAKYLIERAELDKLTRSWDEAYQLYKQAETASEVSPPEEKVGDRSHAMRGQAFVLIEQGKLDEAKRELEACLKLDRNDIRAKHELEYIEQLRAQKR
jgi:tetratricopeptide (TPR) repeat protein